MQKKNLITLLAISLALAVFAMMALKQETKTVTSEVAGKLLFPKLNTKVNDITQLTVQKGDARLSVKKQDNHWVVEEKDNYPANLAKIKQTILGIADFAIVEAKTKKPENHKLLEVDDPSIKGAAGVLVTLTDAQGAVADVVLGKVTDSGFSANSKAKMYVRKNGEDQVWQVTGELHADPEPTDWLLEDIMNIDARRIKQVTIQHPGKPALLINKEKADAAHFGLANMPKGKVLTSETAADDISKGLQSVRLMDVQKADAAMFAKDASVETVFQTVDGLVITAHISTKDNKSLVRFNAAFDPAIRVEPKQEASEPNPLHPTPDPTTTPQDTAQKPAVAQIKAVALVQKEAVELNEKLSPWAYTLAKNKVDVLKKTQAELLKKADK